jgi:general stress protein 26
MNRMLFFCLLGILLIPPLGSTMLSQAKYPEALPADSILAAAREIMGLQTYCALITLDSVGRPEVRTMNPFPPDSEMNVWMATNSRSRKAAEIRQNPKVSLYYADHAHAQGYVTIKGRAILVDDMQEKLRLKREYWTQSFPDWKYLLLIKVVPDRIEVVNYRRGIVSAGDSWTVPYLDLRRP